MEDRARSDEQSGRTDDPTSSGDKSATVNRHSDRLGVACAVGCAVQCGALPLISATLPSLGRFLEVAHSEPLRWSLTAVTGVGACALARAGFLEGKHRYIGVAIGGMALIVAGNVVHADGHQHGTDAREQSGRHHGAESSTALGEGDHSHDHSPHDHNLDHDDPVARRLIAQHLRDPKKPDHEAPSPGSSRECQPSVAVDGKSTVHDHHAHPESHGWAGEIFCLLGGITLGYAHLRRIFGGKRHTH